VSAIPSKTFHGGSVIPLLQFVKLRLRTAQSRSSGFGAAQYLHEECEQAARRIVVLEELRRRAR
jgi:hypothetical protein